MTGLPSLRAWLVPRYQSSTWVRLATVVAMLVTFYLVSVPVRYLSLSPWASGSIMLAWGMTCAGLFAWLSTP